MSFKQGFMFVMGAKLASTAIEKGKEKLDERRKRLKEKDDEESAKITQGAPRD